MTLAVLATVGLTSTAQAQGPRELGPLPQAEPQVAGDIELYKDPLVAAYLSATVPGLGQFYSGQKTRGLLFFTAILGSFGSAYAFYEPAILELSDYDGVANGGNGDGLLSTTEVQNWEERRSEEDAFERLSDGRKAGLVISAVVGAGLYIWNVVDAPQRARARNRQVAQSRVGFDLQARPDGASVALQLRF
jgi:TM2 domain-containing membrane protein YozV